MMQQFVHEVLTYPATGTNQVPTPQQILNRIDTLLLNSGANNHPAIFASFARYYTP